MTRRRAPCVRRSASFMMDLAVRAPRRPASGETVVGTSFDALPRRQGLQPGGGGGAGPGPTPRWSAAWATTTSGREFLALLAREGIDAGCVVDRSHRGHRRRPCRSSRTSGENSIVIVPRANHGVTAADVEAARPR